MRRIFILLLTLTLTLSLAACGGTPEQGNGTQSDPPESGAPAVDAPEQAPPAQPEQTPPADGEGGKTLVVYFSATGNTRAVAETIGETLDADLFELVPETPYTEDDLDWQNEASRVSREHNDASLRTVELVSAAVDNWDSYGTVFIGYPIWWGVAAWPTDSFVSANDFTGKTVIPFCTAASSSIGDSGELLAELAGTGDWQEGTRFFGGVSADEVREWLDGLGL